jgi:hypothetical protein
VRQYLGSHLGYILVQMEKTSSPQPDDQTRQDSQAIGQHVKDIAGTARKQELTNLPAGTPKPDRCLEWIFARCTMGLY